ncbi:endo-1,4-beta-xylanase [Microbulbifer halophilus]|uniref:endo-1,4-beta-xylanase n=1 Tax=Microbulbifer halophilus TaxID=453963 RepID=A0ABW5E8F3_9GAMM|nr:endo-1,4-beta-xylanase [Microbulbifer halophilus]MCW8125865.1 endo-1,4-beta-xylanase [Microbulbifer halophilus]
MTMKNHLLKIAMLSLAVASAGCTNKETEEPDNSAPPDNNAAPIADAGSDRTVTAGESVTLAGSGSDADGTVTDYNWSQVAGPSVELGAGEGGAVTFIAPQTEEAATLELELRVGDDGGASSPPDTVIVTVWPALDKFLGTATESDDDYLNLTTYFDQVTPGNAGKWGSVEATRDQMDWAALDTAHNFAGNHELRYKHHTLLWGQQQPDWLADLSAEEQLQEIDEWMAAVAERYPDLDMIDVVNEPLHAPPAYMEALGGEGDSGWDWLITAFEMAREHFPDSTLILNDYNILNLEESTEDYLMLVELLQELELIDGIGVQAHFLEQISADTVQKNLDLLGGARLPIYVSELDINYADDARHANKLRELFTVFWEHPAVAGVTHWGYREGATWRENAWLLNSDETERPGLEWLRCYAIDGNEDCTVPEYVPAGWSGDESGLVLEAELFDEGEGLLASGEIISHVDVGDWIVFRGVEFQQGWDGLKVNYAKGEVEDGGATGSISVRFDCDDVNSCSEVASVPLPPTGGWNSFDTVDTEWEPTEGKHDVYLRFMSAANVGNIDWLRFGSTEVTRINLVEDGGFEGDTIDSGWSVWYTDEGELALTDTANSGSQGLSLSGRTDAGANRASYDLTGKVEAGETYPVSAWVSHSGPDAAQVTLSYKMRCNDIPDGDSSYSGIEDNTAVPANEWTQLSGELTVPADCDVINEVRIYFENTPLDVETLYYDDVEILGWGTAAPEPGNGDNLVEGDFEAGKGNWTAGNAEVSEPGTIEPSSEEAYSGEQSLKASGFFSSGEDTWGSYAAHDLTDLLEAGTTYAVSAQVLLSQDDVVSITRELNICDGLEQWVSVVEQEQVTAGQWTHLSGQFEVPAGCEFESAQIYFEHTTGGTDVYIDEISVTAQ